MFQLMKPVDLTGSKVNFQDTKRSTWFFIFKRHIFISHINHHLILISPVNCHVQIHHLTLVSLIICPVHICKEKKMAPQKEMNKLRRKLYVNIIYMCVCVFEIMKIALLTLTNTINDMPTSIISDPLQNDNG